MLVDATTRAAMLSFSTPLARELRRALSPGFLCCRNSDVTVVIRRKVVGIDLHIWRPEKFYNSVTLFAVRPIIGFIEYLIVRPKKCRRDDNNHKTR